MGPGLAGNRWQTRTLELSILKQAVAGNAAALRCVSEYQPAGGAGDKVFPPTYSGGVYAVEDRRVNGEIVRCVLLDSVASQANRMELALLAAWEQERLGLPMITVDFADTDLIEVGRNWRITSLEAPHRIADAILRDSMVGNTPFSKSVYADAWGAARLHNATALFRLCPTALLFGTWGSPASPGGLGAKFPRCIVSEIVAINAVAGVRTSSRIDPLGIRKDAAVLYEADVDPSGIGWTIAAKGKKPKKLGKDGKPSQANHGNVTPGLVKYGSGAEGLDPLSGPDVEVEYRFRGRDGELNNFSRLRSRESNARESRIAAGGVTMSHALQTTVISLPALRRLQFPLDGQKRSEATTDAAARTVLAALGLTAATLTREQGCDLRSRCQLHATAPVTWELLDTPGDAPVEYTLPADAAVEMFIQAVAEAKSAGLPWMDEELVLRPSGELVELVRLSQALETQLSSAEGE